MRHICAYIKCIPKHLNSLIYLQISIFKKKKNSTYNSLLNHFDKAGSQSVTGFKAKFNDLIEYIALGNTSLDDIIHSLSYHDNNGFCYSDCTLQRIRFRKIIELNVTTTTTEKSTELEWQP